MTPSELVAIIRTLPEDQPITDAVEGRTTAGYPGSRPPWYRSQKEHLIGFVGEYRTPGAYGRAGLDGSARDWYQRFQCAPGLLWLAEALGEEEAVLRRSVEAIDAAGPRAASRCGAFRRIVPWSRIEELLTAVCPDTGTRADSGTDGVNPIEGRGDPSPSVYDEGAGYTVVPPVSADTAYVRVW